MRLGLNLFVLLAFVGCASDDVPTAGVSASGVPGNVSGVWTITFDLSGSNSVTDTVTFKDSTHIINHLTVPTDTTVTSDTVLVSNGTKRHTSADACTATLSDTITQESPVARLSGLYVLTRTCNGVTDTVTVHDVVIDTTITVDTTVSPPDTTVEIDTTAATTQAGSLTPDNAISLLFNDTHKLTFSGGTRDSVFRHVITYQTNGATDSSVVQDTASVMPVALKAKRIALSAHSLLNGTVSGTSMSGVVGWTLNLQARPNKGAATLLGTWTATKQ